RIREEIARGSEVQLLRTIPGVGEILAPVIWLEIGDVLRFPRAVPFDSAQDRPVNLRGSTPAAAPCG
ncbi:MAG: transposase, partial [Candidatus Acidiferrales bacterium]